MKKINAILQVLSFLSIFSTVFMNDLSAQVAINTSGANPHSSAMLDISSTNKGLLIPTLTTAQRDMIAAPADGLMIYNRTDGKFYYYDIAFNIWREFYTDYNGLWRKVRRKTSTYRT